MGIEENLKSFSISEEENKNPNPILKDEEDEELEEGEVAGEEDDTTSSYLKGGVVEQSHPLEHSWTFWFDNPQAKSKHATLGLYNNIHHPSKLAAGADFHCFKHKIEPKWEDPVCANGGKWTVTFQKGKSDTSWFSLALIGEHFEYGDEICGEVVSVRGKQDKIALWTRTAANETAQVNGVALLRKMTRAIP
ncbi:Eukaryotic translation initiation factor 4E-1 [Hibiscus syriacus]|uniref:Eukaryotic translation initiation factor 4E-1 n=1 Tax=Hibiscus syriacus TaxID=106335 RepID=A0A6A2XB64_HIBSY|nr:Eukaryotic translation initiation factor 4E-1 [Hibiscus syriacus]